MKKKKFKTGKCHKCKLDFYVHEHHILPQANFGKDGETITLCPNCHTHVHVFMELNLTDKNNQKEIQNLWEDWLNYLKIGIITVMILGLGVGFYYI